jgi:hypothetical protein
VSRDPAGDLLAELDRIAASNMNWGPEAAKWASRIRKDGHGVIAGYVNEAAGHVRRYPALRVANPLIAAIAVYDRATSGSAWSALPVGGDT